MIGKDGPSVQRVAPSKRVARAAILSGPIYVRKFRALSIANFIDRKRLAEFEARFRQLVRTPILMRFVGVSLR